MASDDSIASAPGVVHFSQDFVEHIHTYQRVIRGQPAYRWAHARGLGDDLVQLTLMRLADADTRFDPMRAACPHHFRLALIKYRARDSFDHLNRMHGVVVDYDDGRSGMDVADDDSTFESPEHCRSGESRHSDDVLDEVIGDEVARAFSVAMNELPTVQRRVMELALADHSDREIAEQLGVSPQAVNAARQKGLARIRAALQSERVN